MRESEWETYRAWLRNGTWRLGWNAEVRKDTTRTKQENWEIMKAWHNKATRLRRIAIRDYWTQTSAESKCDPKKFYRTFMPFLNDKNVKDKTEITLNIQGTILQDQRSEAEQFADYFATVGESSFDNCRPMNFTPEECDRHPNVLAIRSRWNSNSFTFRKITRKIF